MNAATNAPPGWTTTAARYAPHTDAMGAVVGTHPPGTGIASHRRRFRQCHVQGGVKHLTQPLCIGSGGPHYLGVDLCISMGTVGA